MSDLVQLKGEEEDVVAFVGGDSVKEDEGMRLCIGGDEVGDHQTSSVGDDTVFLVPLDGVGDLVEADTGKIRFLR